MGELHRLNEKVFSSPLVADKSKRLKNLNIYRGCHVLYEYVWMHNVHSLECISIAGYTGWCRFKGRASCHKYLLANLFLGNHRNSLFCRTKRFHYNVSDVYFTSSTAFNRCWPLTWCLTLHWDELYGLFWYFLHSITLNRISRSR